LAIPVGEIALQEQLTVHHHQIVELEWSDDHEKLQVSPVSGGEPGRGVEALEGSGEAGRAVIDV